MISALLKKIVGTKNERELKRIQPLVEKTGTYEEELKGLTDDQLQAKTPFFKERVDKGESLDSLLPEAFAVVRETARRTVRMRHFDSQLIGGIEACGSGADHSNAVRFELFQKAGRGHLLLPEFPVRGKPLE